MALTASKLRVAIGKGNWKCKAMSENDHFYRYLFKLEKKARAITYEEIQAMFCSYEHWKKQIDDMIENCHLSSTADDAEAVQYAEQLDEDIMDQMFHIVTNMPCEKDDLQEVLVELSDQME